MHLELFDSTPKHAPDLPKWKQRIRDQCNRPWYVIAILLSGIHTSLTYHNRTEYMIILWVFQIIEIKHLLQPDDVLLSPLLHIQAKSSDIVFPLVSLYITSPIVIVKFPALAKAKISLARSFTLFFRSVSECIWEPKVGEDTVISTKTSLRTARFLRRPEDGFKSWQLKVKLYKFIPTFLRTMQFN